ncbi:MAG: BamA/TamA family outer membrane protein [Gemmatimonadales bacterium]
MAPRISDVTLERFNVFDRSDSSWVAKIVNSLHYTTRPRFIRREFLFHAGESLDSARIAETARNLRALGVFRDVQIDTTRSDSGVAVNVTTRDAWTTQPDFRFHSTGGSVAYTIALIEDNFLGTITQLQFLYQKNPDRSTEIFELHRNRVIAGKVAATLQYANRSDGNLFFGQMALPYFQLASRYGASLTVNDLRERIFRYRDGALTPNDTLQDRYLLLRGDLSHAVMASPRGYLRLGVAAQLRQDDYLGDSAFRASGFARTTTTGAVGVWAELRRARFQTVHGFESFDRDEDIDLSSVLQLSLFAAPRAFGYDSGHRGVAPGLSAHVGAGGRRGFAYADLSANGALTSAGLDSGEVFAGGTVVILPARRHQILLHGEGGALRNPLPGTEFDLGLGVGPRAFRQHAFTGDREFFATAEYRYTVAPEFLKVVGVGLAAFVDHGGAWWSGDPVRSGWDYGVGLRLGASRAPGVAANRIDLAWRAAQPGLPGGWVVDIGKGFLFGGASRGTAR